MHKSFISVFSSANKFLMATFFMLAIYLAYDLLFVKQCQEIFMSHGDNAAGDESVVSKEVVANVKDYAYYSTMIAGKQIFAITSNSQENVPSEAAILDDEANNLTLVGIVEGQNMQAVIENKKTEKTSTLNKGDSLAGFTVVEITSKKVILDQNGKKVVFSL